MAGHTALTSIEPLRGIIFFGHGSRDPLWRGPIEAVAQALKRQQPDALCECAYLELTEPDLPTASQRLVAQGCTHITILPMFLGTGRHARHDLPLLVDALRKLHPQVTFSTEAAVGEDPRVTALLADIAMRYLEYKN